MDPNNPNLYVYCANNPLILTDPTGLDVGWYGEPNCGGNSGYNQEEEYEETYSVTKAVVIIADQLRVYSEVNNACFSGKGKRDVAEAQAKLKTMGYDIGPCGVDGLMGNDTEKAIRNFQITVGLPPTGKLDANTTALINIKFNNGTRVKKTVNQSASKLLDKIKEVIVQPDVQAGYPDVQRGVIGRQKEY